jgi:hypothetical protein
LLFLASLLAIQRRRRRSGWVCCWQSINQSINQSLMMYLHLCSLKSKFGNKMQNPRSTEIDPKKSELEILQISEIIGIFLWVHFPFLSSS